MSTKRSRVHSKYKTESRVANWPDYDRPLVSRGEITLWLSKGAIAAWSAAPTGRRGAQPTYSDLAIETVLTIRLVLGLPLRQAEGFVRGLFRLMDVNLEVPDHTTLARRARSLDIAAPRKPRGRIHLVLDSTGLPIHGEGEWAAAKHGRDSVRGWRKLHLAVADGVILARELTESTDTDAIVGAQLVKACPASIASVADAAYDTRPFYRAAGKRRAEVIVPPQKKATYRLASYQARDRTVHRVQEVCRRKWMKESVYHQQARGENALFHFKRIIGSRLRARSLPGQRVEVALGCRALNIFTALGRPRSVAVGR